MTDKKMVSDRHCRFLTGLERAQLEGVFPQKAAQSANWGHQTKVQNRKQHLRHHSPQYVRKPEPKNSDGCEYPRHNHVHNMKNGCRIQESIPPRLEIEQKQQEHHGHAAIPALVFGHLLLEELHQVRAPWVTFRSMFVVRKPCAIGL